MLVQRLRNMFRSNLAGSPERNMEEGYADGRENHELQELEYGNHLDHRLESTSSSNNVEMPQNLKDTSSRLFNICKRGDIVCFLEEINFLYEHEKNCLYNILFSQDEEDQDTFLHVAIKRNNVDLVKEILHILGEPYNSDDSYECRYFKDKKENEKPLSKVINARNREFCKALEYINNEEIAQLFIKYYNGRIKNLREELDNSYIQLEQAKRTLHRRRSIFSYSGVGSFVAQVCRIGFDVCRAVFDEAIRRIPFLGLSVSSTLGLLASPPGLMVHLIHCTNEEILRYEEENSSLEKELNSCIEERRKLKGELRRLQNRVEMDLLSQQVREVSFQNQSYTGEIGRLREEVRSLRNSTQMNSVSMQLAVSDRGSIFYSTSTPL